MSYPEGPHRFAKLRVGADRGVQAVFPPEAREQVAGAIKARRSRALAPEEAHWQGFKPTHRMTSSG